MQAKFSVVRKVPAVLSDGRVIANQDGVRPEFVASYICWVCLPRKANALQSMEHVVAGGKVIYWTTCSDYCMLS